MPYIKQQERDELMNLLIKVVDLPADNAGQLNYILTTVIISYLNKHGKKYQTMNDIVGALEGAKAEFQRRVVAPYEDEKIRQNGDVY